MESVIVVAGIVIIYVIVSNYYRIQGARENQKKIKERFGRKPEHKEKNIEKIRLFLENRKKAAVVDDITWNDLSMDEVFFRINNCASSVGEQILYDTMHNTERSAEELEHMEASVQFFTEHEKERGQVLTCLAKLGKRESSYYIPPYMESIEENKVGSDVLFHILQILPVVFLGGFFITRNFDFIGLFVGNLIVNIDMIISIASFRKSIEFYAVPEFEEANKMELEEAYHPLLEAPVCNSINWNRNCIITGSNASGKSTFIKAAAVNAILEYLCQENCLVMVASHDQELTVLLQECYDNYHFSEKIGQQDIEFDYKIYPGPATSQNAIRLLEYVGFPQEIIADARQKIGV